LQTTDNIMSNALADLSVTDMSISALETELELLEAVYSIFIMSKDVEIDGLATPVKESIQAYGNRIRDIKNEIFERQVLVKS
jgi:hypothetical protein